MLYHFDAVGDGLVFVWGIQPTVYNFDGRQKLRQFSRVSSLVFPHLHGLYDMYSCEADLIAWCLEWAGSIHNIGWR